MATPMNFQALNFGNISQQEAEARRRYYDSLGSIGGVISSTGDKVDDYLQRKQKEAEDKKKWDNMIAQQEYQKEQDRLNKEYQASRDAVADARYNNEWNAKLEDRRLEAGKRMNEHAALEKYREGLKKSYTPEFLKKYGPTAQAELEAALAATTIAESMAAGGRLGQIKFQQDMMDFQREQAQNADSKDAEYKKQLAIKNAVQSGLFKNRIDITGTRLPKTKAEAQAQIALIDSYLGNDFLGGIDTFDGTAGTGELAFKLQYLKELLSKVGTPKKKPPRDWEKNKNTNL